jgi:peptidoglycan/xylan/chitin deacetylase (PgdA/CDA1 family)
MSADWHDPLSVAPRTLARQVGAARRLGWEPTTLAGVVGGRRRAFHVTFDDAFRSVTAALPVLARAAVPATVFACTEFAGRTLDLPPLRAVAAEHRHELTTLSWDELRDAAERGVEVGSHTRRHFDLRGLSDAALQDELATSREQIESELGRRCRYLAYPYGQFDRRVQLAAERAGYDAAVGLVGVGNLGGRFGIPRVDATRDDGPLRVAFKSTRAWPLVVPPLRRLRGLRARLT